MPRQPKLALGVAALALALGLAVGLAPRPLPAAVRKTSNQAQEHPVNTQASTHPVADSHADAGSHPADAGHGGGEPNILEPQPSLALWTVVVFLGLMFVLRRFAWTPLLAALHHREEHLEHVLSETERARNESEQLLAEHRLRMASAEDQVRALIEEARKNAQAAGDEIIKRAQAEAEASKQRAEQDIRSSRDQALHEIWSKTAELAVSVAGKVLSKSLSGEDHQRLIDAAVRELPESPGALNGQGGHRA
ncbi:MAG: hypothetical protein NVSMB9_16300 [Isosphaeraceae bacterium]